MASHPCGRGADSDKGEVRQYVAAERPCNAMATEWYPGHPMGHAAYPKRFVILLTDSLDQAIKAEAKRRHLAPSTWARVTLSTLVEGNGQVEDVDA